MVKLKKIIIVIKELRKKIKNQNNKGQIKNMIPSIWIEKWSWKLIKFLQKYQGKKLE